MHKYQIVLLVALLAVTAKGESQVVYEQCAIEKKIDPATAGINERIAALHVEQGFKLEAKRIAPLLRDINAMKENDRIVAADLMYASRSLELARMHELLDFSPSNDELKKARLTVLAKIDALSGLVTQSITDEKSAIDIHGSESDIINLISLDRHPDAGSIETYSNLVASIKDSNPFKPFAQGIIEVRKNGWKNSDRLKSLFKTSLDACPANPLLAESYADALMSSQEYSQATRVYETIRSKNPSIYSPAINVALAEIYAGGDEFSKLPELIDSAENASIYLDQEMRIRLKNIRRASSDHDARVLKRWTWATYLLGALCLILLIGLLKSNRQRTIGN